MIAYDNRSYLRIVFRWSGSLIWSKLVLLPVLVSCVICVVVFHFPDALRLSEHLEWPAWVYSTVLTFAIIFRTSLAYNRFFEGVTASMRMFSLWRSAFVSLLGFIDASIEEHKHRGNDQIIEEVLDSKSRLLHWFSLLFAVAVQTLQWRQEPDLLRPMRVEEESERERRRSFWSEITEFDKCDRVHIHSSPTRKEVDVLQESFDKLTIIIQWIQSEVSRMHLFNRIFIHSSIVTRVYEELSSGMLAYCEAHTIAFIPFPFLFAQVLSYALYSFSILCPFIVQSSLGEQDGGLVQEPWSWPALVLMNMLLVGGFAGLNEIATELEDPFTEKLNNFPLRVFQRRVDAALVDTSETILPSDFKLEDFGEHIAGLGSNAEHLTILRALDPKQRPAPAGTGAVARIVGACEELRLWVIRCVQDVYEDNVELEQSIMTLEQQLSQTAYLLFLSKGLSQPGMGPRISPRGDTQREGTSGSPPASPRTLGLSGEEQLRKLLKESARVNREMSPMLIRELLFGSAQGPPSTGGRATC